MRQGAMPSCHKMAHLLGVGTVTRWDGFQDFWVMDVNGRSRFMIAPVCENIFSSLSDPLGYVVVHCGTVTSS